jgi:hypothetical protein
MSGEYDFVSYWSDMNLSFHEAKNIELLSILSENVHRTKYDAGYVISHRPHEDAKLLFKIYVYMVYD